MEVRNENIVLIIIISLLVILFLGGFSGYGMMGCFSPFGFGFMWIFMFLIWVLFLILLVLGILWLIKQLQSPTKHEETKRGKK